MNEGCVISSCPPLAPLVPLAIYMFHCGVPLWPQDDTDEEAHQKMGVRSWEMGRGTFVWVILLMY